MMDINRVILELLDKRGINGDENIREFLSPKPLLTYDPFLLKNMKEGVDLILDNVNKNNKICIYGDYDADGVTSVSILMEVFTKFTDNVTYYVPSRFEEGYGLNKVAIKELHDEGINLIITVDCGIVSFDEVDYAKELGMDIIVTDHHSLGDKLPSCLVINPKQEGCNYPFKSLAGCGVSFKLSQALQRTLDLPKSTINRVLDLVALGTIGDVVPLVDENRTMVKYGMAEMLSGRRDGLKKLIKKTVKDTNKMTSENISYGIVPHLNAAGRMESAKIGIELFTSKDDIIQDEKVEKLLDLNKQRKLLQQETFEKCIDTYEKQYTEYEFPIIKMDYAHEGITGIVAGKMKDYCNKPVAIVTKDGENYKGTCRSIEAVDIYEVLSKERNLFLKFGGHSSACGFTIEESKINLLQNNIEMTMSNMDIDKEGDNFKYDLVLKGEDISLDLAKELLLLEPFGCENEKPTFLIKDVIVKDIIYMGSNKEHMKFKAEINGYGKLDCICFNYTHIFKFDIYQGCILDIVGSFDINYWNGREKLQFMINNIKLL